jgi:hypothetical protein
MNVKIAFHTYKGTQTEGIWEQSAEENVWSEEG